MELRFSSRFLGASLRIGRQPNTHFLFVRHGESTGNVDYTVKRTTPNPALPLTPLGEQQALEVAKFLPAYITDNCLMRDVSQVSLWSSRYRRAIQTAEPIEVALCDAAMSPKRRYADYLNEIDSGSIDGHNYHEVMEEPQWQRHAQRDKLLHEHGYGYLARRGDGERYVDASRRFDGVMDSIYRDADQRGHRLVIIVCHGLLMKVAYGRLSHADRRDRDWHQTFNGLPSVPNCGVMHFTSHDPRVINPLRFGLVFQPSSTMTGQEA